MPKENTGSGRQAQHRDKLFCRTCDILAEHVAVNNDFALARCPGCGIDKRVDVLMELMRDEAAGDPDHKFSKIFGTPGVVDSGGRRRRPPLFPLPFVLK